MRSIETGQRCTGVKQSTPTRPAARKIARQQQRITLADYSIGGMGRVHPMRINPDHWVIDRPKALDGLVRPGEIALNAIRRAAEPAQRRFHLGAHPPDHGQGPIVGIGAIVPGPENGDFLIQTDSSPRLFFVLYRYSVSI